MKFPLSYYEGLRDEISRISFVEHRDGVEGALDFASQTVSQYENAMRTRKGVASDRARLPRFRGSIRYLKYYMRTRT